MTCKYSDSYCDCIQVFHVSTTMQIPKCFEFLFLFQDWHPMALPTAETLTHPYPCSHFPHQSDDMKPLDSIKGELEKLGLDHGH